MFLCWKRCRREGRYRLGEDSQRWSGRWDVLNASKAPFLRHDGATDPLRPCDRPAGAARLALGGASLGCRRSPNRRRRTSGGAASRSRHRAPGRRRTRRCRGSRRCTPRDIGGRACFARRLPAAPGSSHAPQLLSSSQCGQRPAVILAQSRLKKLTGRILFKSRKSHDRPRARPASCRRASASRELQPGFLKPLVGETRSARRGVAVAASVIVIRLGA